MGLELSKNYSLRLRQPWGTLYSVRITGITAIDDASRYSDFDILGQFFEPKKLGFATYLNSVTDVRIFVCNKITSTDPVTLDKKAILIPESMIDYSSVTEMVPCKSFRVVSNHIVRRYDGPIEERNAQMALTADLKKQMINVKELVAEQVDFVIDEEHEVLYDKPIMDQLDSHREDIQNKHEQYLVQLERDREAERLQLIADQAAARQAKAEYEAMRAILNDKIAEADALISEQRIARDGLNGTRTIVIGIMQRIRAGNYIPEQLPTFDEIYQEVLNGL